MLGSGKELMNTMLFSQNKRIEWYVPLLRIVGPILSFSTGIAGGIFAPALSAGAAFGSLVAGWFQCLPSDTNLLIFIRYGGFFLPVLRVLHLHPIYPCAGNDQTGIM